MFTGIVTDVGQVREAAETAAGRRLVIATAFELDTVTLGASIACNGTCVTVVDKGADWFAADVSLATLSCTTLGDWAAGRGINLERPLQVGDELGGHMVLGHVDGVGAVAQRRPDGENLELEFDAPYDLAGFIASKGSVTVDGVSLTINRVADLPAGARFAVNVIPHTLQHTTLGALAVGDRVNLEVDVMARYAARLMNRSEV